MKLPIDRQKIFVDDALYTKYDIEDIEDEALVKLFMKSGTVDAWCEKCSENTVFAIKNKIPDHDSEMKEIPSFEPILVEATCTRNRDGQYSRCRGKLFALFDVDFRTITKIGQHPSAADTAFAQFDRSLENELTKEQRNALGRAIGLHAHGVGAGSVIYLRKIIESLIAEAHDIGKNDDGWDENAYFGASTAERIKMLSNHLPKRLVGNTKLYAVMSRAVHEFTEAECNEHYDVIMASIKSILREKADEKEHQQAVSALNQVASKTS